MTRRISLSATRRVERKGRDGQIEQIADRDAIDNGIEVGKL